jgi:heme/copper-type cytochrome/quinol oxidase subunit 2
MNDCHRRIPFFCTLLCASSILAGCFPAMPATNSLPQTTSERVIEVTGRDYQLHFRYAGADEQLHSDDDRYGAKNLSVVAGERVCLRLLSCDFIYTIEIPIVGVYEIAAPDLVFESRFIAPEPGVFQILASQMCGYDHPDLLGSLLVETEAGFSKTMNSLASFPIHER